MLASTEYVEVPARDRRPEEIRFRDYEDDSNRAPLGSVVAGQCKNAGAEEGMN